jgi:hypothetical protein
VSRFSSSKASMSIFIVVPSGRVPPTLHRPGLSLYLTNPIE